MNEPTFKIESVEQNENGAIVITIASNVDNATFIQDELYTEAGVAVTPYGALIYDGTARGQLSSSFIKAPKVALNGVEYDSNSAIFEQSDDYSLHVSAIKPGVTLPYSPVQPSE